MGWSLDRHREDPHSVTVWVRRVSLSSENCKPNHEFRSFRAKMKEKYSRRWEQGQQRKKVLIGWGQAGGQD